MPPVSRAPTGSGDAMTQKKIRYAVVGLGYISQIAMLPAFRGAAGNSELAALVSGDQRKLKQLGRKYGARQLVDYDSFDALLESGDIDALYVGLPNTLHRDCVERAARAGIHVLCDKPMAMTVADCQAMIDIAKARRTKLAIAYRLDIEAANLAAFKLIRSGRLGKLRFFASEFAQQVRPGNIRTRAELGGGPLYDMGIYCVNAARHVFEAEPEEVVARAARSADKRFAEIDETVQAIMRFPGDGLASFTCSFGAADLGSYKAWGVKGGIELAKAYEMAGEKTLRITLPRESKAPRTRVFPPVDQFAALLVHFSDCILKDRRPVPSAEEGLADIRVLEAITRSLREDKPARLEKSPFLGLRLAKLTPIDVAPHRPPPLLRAEKPSRE
jgi:predicted dehydrogenase